MTTLQHIFYAKSFPLKAKLIIKLTNTYDLFRIFIYLFLQNLSYILEYLLASNKDITLYHNFIHNNQFMENKIQYQTELQLPQLQFLYAENQQLQRHLQYLVQQYKFLVINLTEVLEKNENMNENSKSKQQKEQQIKKYNVPRTLKKEIALQGAKRFLIVNFPQSVEIFRQFQKITQDDVEIKKIIIVGNICESVAKTEKNNNIGTQEDFTWKLFRIDPSLPNEQIDKQVKIQFTQQGIHPLAPVEVFFVSGGPGAGKGTQCFNLVKDYGFRHLSTGDLLREAIKNGSKQGLAIDECIKNGKLVSSDLLVNLIKSEIARNQYEGKYLIDGFPRNVENDEVWRKMMEDHAIVRGLIYMKCGEEIMQHRILQRAKTSGRSDDNIDTIKKRFKVYYNQTEPIIQKYKKQNSVIQINAELTPQEVYKEIQKELDKKGFIPKDKHCKGKPSVILILGGPGSGKGTQCVNLVKQFGFKHLSSGDLLRQEVKKKGLNCELIQDYVVEGKLVPSKICVRLIKKSMQQRGWDGIYLLDGYPRNLQNIQSWQQEVGNEVCFLHTILFSCSYKVMEQRLLIRGQSSGRIDDNAQSIKKRFQTFENETKPIIAKFQEGDINIKINAQQSIQKVFEDLRKALIEKGLKPVR